MVQRWKIPDSLSGIRADHYLVYHIGRISRSKAQKVIASGDFRLEQQLLKPSRRLKAGDWVELWRVPPDSSDIEHLTIPILYQDERILALNKPGNIAIHPSARYLYQTVTHWLKTHFPGKPIHPCHRLDRETSGILLCSQNRATDSALKQAFMKGQVEKTYWAFVEGHLDREIDCARPLCLQGGRGKVAIKMIEDSSGFASQTYFRPLRYDPMTDWTLVECKPKTGRQHQIRAHLALEGFPIVGDKLYSMGEDFFDAYTRGVADLSQLPLPRQALHARSIRFELQSQIYSLECSHPFFDAFLTPNPDEPSTQLVMDALPGLAETDGLS
ncbi:MAG: RluA family pseudouridine synthase [Myxococcaceae bacterium]|nr:RluA family pseudouridine synthase [Myxococcaceae bacterium]